MLKVSEALREPALRLAGKVALVSGAGRGIGAAIATELAQQGAAVAIGYHASRQPAEQLAAQLADSGLTAAAFSVDTSSPRELRALMARVDAQFGGLDILVNNAGITHTATIENVSEELLDEMLAVNVKGVYLAIREALKYLRDGGRIINIGSISSDYMPYGGNSLYVMTKSAISGLTRGLTRELAARHITINNVQPGRVETDLLKYALGEDFDRARRATPLGRFGDAAEVAHVVAFLCGTEAGYVTGANLRVDGGVSV